MGEPTIYKPSIYNGNGVYKNGASGGGGGGLKPGQIVVGNQVLDTIEINGLIWCKENLKIILDGIAYQPGDKWYLNAACKWYNNDPTTYGIYGQNRSLLYNAKCIPIITNYLEENIAGWRIPSISDFQNLITFCGGSSEAQKKCSAQRLWPDLTGITDEFGLSFIPTGRVINGNFGDINQGFYMCTDDNAGIGKKLALINSSPSIFNADGTYTMSYNYDYTAIRLCKDT